MNGSSISLKRNDSIRSLLMEFWKILKIGIIEDLNKLTYKTYDESEIKNKSAFNCSRNKKTNLVDYFLDGVLVSSLLTGLAQRPLFCKKKDAIKIKL